MLAGVVAGDTRTITATISMQTPVVEMRGEEVRIQFDVLHVQRLNGPSLMRNFWNKWAWKAATNG